MKNFEEKRDELLKNVNDLWSRAYHDSLTQLRNRPAVEDVLLTELNKLESEQDYSFALLYMDLNGFKSVNDSLGHDAGDQLLKEVANRLKSLHHDYAFRLGGDEFATVLPDCPELEEALKYAQQICACLSEEYSINEQTTHVSPSIGVYFCDNQTELESDNLAASREILNRGDEAMYQAKMLSKTSLFMPNKTDIKRHYGRVLPHGSVVPVRFPFPDYQAVLRSGYGEGRLLADNFVQDCVFKFTQYSDGDLRLVCRLNAYSVVNKSPINDVIEKIIWRASDLQMSFEGTVETPENGRRCVISLSNLSAFSTNTIINGVENHTDVVFGSAEANLDFTRDLVSSIKFYITNLRFPHDPFDNTKDLHLTLEQFSIRISRAYDEKNYDRIVDELDAVGGVSVTCWAEIQLPAGLEVKEIVEDFDTVCFLLTFLQGSTVNWVSYDLLSSKKDVIHSHCRDSVTGKLASKDSSALWTISYLQAAVPEMFKNFPLKRNTWNLQTVIAFLSNALNQTDYLEVRGYKLVHCIELLVHAHKRQQGKVENTNDFSIRLHDLLLELNIRCSTNNDESQEAALKRITNDIVVLRHSLQHEGTFDLPGYCSDKEQNDNLNSERCRRFEFLSETTRNLIESILYPRNNNVLCGAYLHQWTNTKD